MIGTLSHGPVDQTTDEAHLIRYARSGEPAALEELVARHFAPAHRIATRALRDPGVAEDAVEEALVASIESP